MPESAGVGTLVALLLVIAASVYLGTKALRVVQRSAFLKSYFLGNRGLGPWVLALTATVQSGGTFMGFPSYVYSYGWVVALWIASYMVLPLSSFGVLGKRLAQLSRRTGAITIPDLFRARFASPAVGLAASLLILLFMTIMMVAQFKAGALIMKICWPGSGTLALSEGEENLDRYYYLGLAIFTLTVVGYTLIGGFLAAVWTDLFQSILMLVGVLLLLGLTLHAVGGLDNANRTLQYEVSFQPVTDEESIKYIVLEEDEARLRKLADALRRYADAHDGRLPDDLKELSIAPSLMTDPITGFPFLYYGKGRRITEEGAKGRTLVALTAADAGEWRTALYSDGTFRFGKTSEPGALSTGPGPFGFHPLGVAVSFFFLWVFSGLGSPAGMVRLMASKSTDTIRKSISLLAVYNSLIYLPLIVIGVCGRALLPDLPPSQSDEFIPRMAVLTTNELWGGSFVAGLILAAPFGAVMATVSSYLIVIASGLVRDIYQRFINPQATTRQMRRLSYIVIAAVGLVAVGLNLNPPRYLQAVVVLSGTCGATAFVAAAVMAAFWRRATAAGVLSAMLTGTGTTLILYTVGWLDASPRGYYPLLGFHPLLWGLLTSAVAGVAVSLLTRPPDEARVSLCFDVLPDAKSSPSP